MRNYFIRYHCLGTYPINLIINLWMAAMERSEMAVVKSALVEVKLVWVVAEYLLVAEVFLSPSVGLVYSSELEGVARLLV